MSIIPRFYETNITISHSDEANNYINLVNFTNNYIDRVPTPAPAPACRPCAPAPACRPCAPAPAPRPAPRAMSGGQLASTYTFRPDIFKMSNNNQTTTDRIPVYFDYYTFFNLAGATNIISSRTITRPSGVLNNLFTSSLFILDKNKIPHYISPTEGAIPPRSYNVCKKNNYTSKWSSSSLIENRKIFLDIILNNLKNTNIIISNITLTPIPRSLEIPETTYCKDVGGLPIPRHMPVVEQPAPPAPAPSPRPAPAPAPAPRPAPGPAP